MRSEIAFWDTSALVPLCCGQPESSGRSQHLFKLFRKPVIWWGTPVEVRSALVRLRWEKSLSERQMLNAIHKWEMLERVVREVNPTEQVRGFAKSIPQQHQLRTLDAFQLAAALAWCQSNPRRRPFICFDDVLAHAAESAGFAVHTLKPA